MKKYKIIISVLILFSIFGIVLANNSSTNNGYNTPILDNSLDFSAYESGGKVYTNWGKYSGNETLKYYKVVKSTTTSDPVYPDNGYIAYSTDINFTQYVDSSKNYKNTYYRVCVITNENNRYCSNVVTIYPSSINDNSTTSSTPTTSNSTTLTTKSSEISSTLKTKSDKIVNSFIAKMKEKNYTNEQIVTKINLVNSKLIELKNNKPTLKNIILYIISKLEEKKSEYEDDFNDIETIFDL